MPNFKTKVNLVAVAILVLLSTNLTGALAQDEAYRVISSEELTDEALTGEASLGMPVISMNAAEDREETVGPNSEILDPLHSQMDYAAGYWITSQDFQDGYLYIYPYYYYFDFNAYDSEAADDFVVPQGERWIVEEVEASGFLNYAGTDVEAVHVRFYEDNGGVPSTVSTETYINLSPITGSNPGDLFITLPTALTLEYGTYWVSVQAVVNWYSYYYNGYGYTITPVQWGWEERTIQDNAESAWRNPPGGFGTLCSNWDSRRLGCGVGVSQDLMFALGGSKEVVADLEPEYDLSIPLAEGNRPSFRAHLYMEDPLGDIPFDVFTALVSIDQNQQFSIQVHAADIILDGTMGGVATVSIPWDATPGEHTIVIDLDSDGRIAETDENNNMLAVDMSVAACYPLAVSVVNISQFDPPNAPSESASAIEPQDIMTTPSICEEAGHYTADELITLTAPRRESDGLNIATDENGVEYIFYDWELEGGEIHILKDGKMVTYGSASDGLWKTDRSRITERYVSPLSFYVSSATDVVARFMRRVDEGSEEGAPIISRFPVNGPHDTGYKAGSNGSDYRCNEDSLSISNNECHEGGMDVAARVGERVVATQDGIVVDIGYTTGGGNSVTIMDDNGWLHTYVHLSAVCLCSEECSDCWCPDCTVAARSLHEDDCDGRGGDTGAGQTFGGVSVREDLLEGMGGINCATIGRFIKCLNGEAASNGLCVAETTCSAECSVALQNGGNISAGTVLGFVGSTADTAISSHLHYEVTSREIDSGGGIPRGNCISEVNPFSFLYPLEVSSCDELSDSPVSAVYPGAVHQVFLLDLSLVFRFNEQEGVISVAKRGALPPPSDTFTLLPRYYDITATMPNNTFEVDVTFPYTDQGITAAGLAEENLTVVFYDETAEQWEEANVIAHDTVGNTITVNTTHLSPWTIGALTVPNDAPDVSGAFADPSDLWPPNNKMNEITIENVTDPDGDSVIIVITAITQDEPGGSKHEPDSLGLGTDTASLRAERDGDGNGRVYEITFTATDDQGASSTGRVTVCVPHDQGAGSTCTDDGQTYDAASGESLP